MSLPFLALKLGDKMVQYSLHAFSVVVQQLQKCPFPSTFLQQKTENLERHTERKRIRGYFWTRYVALLASGTFLYNTLLQGVPTSSGQKKSQILR